MKEHGLRSAYVNQHPVRQFIREVMALPNLPATHIRPAFTQLKSRGPTNSEQLSSLLCYVEKTWIDSESRKPDCWTTFKRAVRTNNDVEGWHRRLNTHLRTAHPNIYLLISHLHKEAALLPLQVRLVAQGKLYRNQRRQASSKQAKLQLLWQRYEDSQVSTSEYLRLCAALADHEEE